MPELFHTLSDEMPWHRDDDAEPYGLTTYKQQDLHDAFGDIDDDADMVWGSDSDDDYDDDTSDDDDEYGHYGDYEDDDDEYDDDDDDDNVDDENAQLMYGEDGEIDDSDGQCRIV